MSKGLSIKKILLPVDGSKPSEKAAEYAIYMAKTMKAHVVAIHVMSIPAYAFTVTPIEGMPTPTAIPIPITVSSEERRVAQSYLERVEKIGKTAGVTIEIRIVENQQSVVQAITEFAERGCFDLIVMGTKGRTGITKFLLGSVASGVLTYAPCPVLVVR